VTVHREHKVKRENKQDATNSMFIIKLQSQHVSGIIIPGLILLTMGIMTPETCWDISLIMNIELVASC